MVTLGIIAASLQTSKRTAERRAAKERWPHEERQSIGGEYHLYHPSDLPPDVKTKVVSHLLRTGWAGVEKAERAPSSAQALQDWQRKTAEARASILKEVDRMASASSISHAIELFITLAERALLAAEIACLIPVANARSGKSGSRTVSRRSLYRWRKELLAGDAENLAPRKRAEREIPIWAPALLKIYRQPQKVSLAWALEKLTEHLTDTGVEAPSYYQAHRFLSRLSTVEKNRGRMGPRELKSLQPYVQRDVSDLDPLDVVEMDGHTFDSEVQHPSHGQPFKPELTHVLDVKTRVCLGWSASLKESSHAVMGALLNATQSFGVPAILYTDRGSGYNAMIVSNECIGVLGRIGTRHEQSLPYNSQARGIIERAHKSIWIRGAREMASYLGRDMDKEASGKVHKLTRRGELMLMTWEMFTRWCQKQVDDYNARPHRSLPKLRDKQTGRIRHQSPMEAYQEAIADGFRPLRMSEGEMREMFRPHREAVTHRGLVHLFGNTYFHEQLQHYGGEKVQVGYDIWDPRWVHVRDKDGRFICKAEFEGNKRAFFPVAVVEQAREDRAKAREKRIRLKLEEVEAERMGPALEHEPSTPLTVEEIELAEAKFAEFEPVAALPSPAPAGGRPMFRDDAEWIAWLLANPQEITTYDRDNFERLKAFPSFHLMHGDVELPRQL
jgi:putative transposase